MMDKKVTLLLLALLPLMVNAQIECHQNGIIFWLSSYDKTAQAKSIDDKTTEVGIPATVTYDGDTYKVTSIDGRAFAEEKGLTGASIGHNVTEIGYGAFYGCTKLSKANIPPKVREIKACTFQDCPIPCITIPEGVEVIYTSAFQGSGLKNVVIPNSAYSVQSNAFAECRQLESVTIGYGLNTVSDNMFVDCGALKTVIFAGKEIIADGVTETVYFLETILENAFSGCSSLTSIDIPPSVGHIGKNAFDGQALTNVTVHWKDKNMITTPHYTNFPNRQNGTLHVPKGTAVFYKASPFWKDFKKFVEDVE